MNIEELKLDIKWWESKRWIFNLAIGICGAYAIYQGLSESSYHWSSADTIGIIWFGIGANFFYSLGLLLELFDWYYLKNKIGVKRFRFFFFITGLLFSCIWTFWCNWLYFIGHIW